MSGQQKEQPMRISHIILRRKIARLTEGKTVFYVTGMRRSGNHACIGWLANALEGRSTELKLDSEYSPLRVSQSGDTVCLNEVNMVEPRRYLAILKHARERLSRCKHLIVSTEDVGPDYASWRIPEPKHRIYVRRGLLNLVASRVRALHNSAASGVIQPRMRIGPAFFRALKAWSNPPSDFHAWDFDKWLQCSEYRSRFLAKLELSDDIAPPMNASGNGSSFSGMRAPTTEEMMIRFAQVRINDDLIQRVVESGLLEPAELEVVTRSSS